MHLASWKHGNEEVRLNMVCTQYRLLWLPGRARARAIKVWFCIPRRRNNVACCFKCCKDVSFVVINVF